jgi:hypothetical protein
MENPNELILTNWGNYISKEDMKFGGFEQLMKWRLKN